MVFHRWMLSIALFTKWCLESWSGWPAALSEEVESRLRIRFGKAPVRSHVHLEVGVTVDLDEDLRVSGTRSGAP